MCGRYNVTDSPEVQALMEQLGLPGVAPRPQHNVPPGGIGEFVIEAEDDRYLLQGIWSLLIEPNPNGYGFRPNPKFHTFNARSDRLTSSPLWKKVYPTKRCIIPVSAFHEWKGKQVYNIHPQNEATALAGLWQSWRFGEEQVNSFTVITLPPHPSFSHIHPKSIPLMLFFFVQAVMETSTTFPQMQWLQMDLRPGGRIRRVPTLLIHASLKFIPPASPSAVKASRNLRS